MSSNLFTGPMFPPDLRAKIADRYATFHGWRMEGEGGEGEGGEGEGGGEGQTFTQADIDKIIGKTRTEERRKAAEKYADYDDLKTKAAEKVTLEERVAGIEQQSKASEDRALRAEVAIAKGLTPTQAKRLIGSTREDLEADADELLKDIGAQKKTGNHVPREGNNPKPGNGDSMREFARDLFGRANSE